MVHIRERVWAMGLLTATILVAGCGGGGGSGSSSAPPRQSLKAQIEDVENALRSGETSLIHKQYDLALADFDKARKLASQARGIAQGKQKSELDNLFDKAKKKWSEADRLARSAPPPEAKKTPVASGAEDPEAASKREADERKRKEAEKVALLEKQRQDLLQRETKTVAPETAEEDRPKPAGETKPADANAGPNAPAPEEPARRTRFQKVAFFPEINDQAPEIEVVKLSIKNDHAFVYFQLFNKTDTGRRIQGVVATLCDADHQPLFETNVAFEYNAGFREDGKDPYSQPGEGLTMGSHEVPGFDGLEYIGSQLVCVAGPEDKAKIAKVKKASVAVVFQDGTRLDARGPQERPAPGEKKTGPEGLFK